MGMDFTMIPFRLEEAEKSSEVIFPLCRLPVEREEELHYFLLNSEFEAAPGDWVFDEVEHTLPGGIRKTLQFARPDDFGKLEIDIADWSPTDRAAIAYIRELNSEFRVLIDSG